MTSNPENSKNLELARNIILSSKPAKLNDISETVRNRILKEIVSHTQKSKRFGENTLAGDADNSNNNSGSDSRTYT